MSTGNQQQQQQPPPQRISFTNYENINRLDLVERQLGLGGQQALFWSLLYLEIFFHVVCILHVVMSMAVSLVKHYYHSNLTIIVVHSECTSLLVVIVRCILVFHYLGWRDQSSSFCTFLSALYCCCICTSFLFVLAVVIERLLATVKVAVYERGTHREVIVTVAVVCYPLAALLVYLNVIDRPIISAGIMAVTSGVSVLGLSLLLRHNRRKYGGTLSTSSMSGLSARYQLAENIRVLRLFQTLLNCIGLLTGVGIACFIGLQMASETAAATGTFVFHIVVDFNLIPLPWLWWLQNPRMFAHARRALITKLRLDSCLTNRVMSANESDTAVTGALPVGEALQTIDGRPMWFSPSEQRARYFELYEQFWR